MPATDRSCHRRVRWPRAGVRKRPARRLGRWTGASLSAIWRG